MCGRIANKPTRDGIVPMPVVLEAKNFASWLNDGGRALLNRRQTKYCNAGRCRGASNAWPANSTRIPSKAPPSSHRLLDDPAAPQQNGEKRTQSGIFDAPGCSQHQIHFRMKPHESAL